MASGCDFVWVGSTEAVWFIPNDDDTITVIRADGSRHSVRCVAQAQFEAVEEP